MRDLDVISVRKATGLVLSIVAAVAVLLLASCGTNTPSAVEPSVGTPATSAPTSPTSGPAIAAPDSTPVVTSDEIAPDSTGNEVITESTAPSTLPPLSTPVSVPGATTESVEPDDQLVSTVAPEFVEQYQPAGTTCAVSASESARVSGRESVGTITFVVPSGLLAYECRVLAFTDEPFNVQCDCVYPIEIYRSGIFLAGQLDQLTEQLRNEEEFAQPVTFVSRNFSVADGTTTWAFDLEFGEDPAGFDWPHRERQIFLDADGLTVIARELFDSGPDEYAATLAAAEELLGSLTIDRPDAWDTHADPRSGGHRCDDDLWSYVVPDGWFSNGCWDLNTSTEGDVALQCECNGPLRIGSTLTLIDDPTMLTAVTNDELRIGTGQLDGRTIRTIDGMLPFDRTQIEGRQILVDLGSHRVVLTGYRS